MPDSGKKPGKRLKLSKETSKQLRELKPRKETNVKGGARGAPYSGRVEPPDDSEE